MFGWEWAVFISALRNTNSPAHRSPIVLAPLLRPIHVGRVILFVASTIFSVLAIFNADGLGAIWGTIAFLTTTASQLLERHTYFTASAAPRMPGGVPT